VEKHRAAYYFFIYTFLGSVFMLLGMLTIYSLGGSTDFVIISSFLIERDTQIIVFLGFFLSLAIKIPQIPFHI
jgi:NADH:ubiquinone oxidoreductase subunit 4 (subunit M)